MPATADTIRPLVVSSVKPFTAFLAPVKSQSPGPLLVFLLNLLPGVLPQVLIHYHQPFYRIPAPEHDRQPRKLAQAGYKLCAQLGLG